MNQDANPWNVLATKNFNTQIKQGEIDPESADNILIAWPPIVDGITQTFPQIKGLSALDYGCGTGAFCAHLEQMGFTVTGIDPAAEMIRIAKDNTPQTIHYITGDHANMPAEKKFDVITSIMTFPFIKDINGVFSALTSALYENGIFVFAVFNPAWVTESLKDDVWFADFNSIDHPKNGWKTFGNMRMPVYIRNAAEYDDLALRNGLVKIMEDNPLFTQAFLGKYPDYVPNNVSEYLILGYKKQHQ